MLVLIHILHLLYRYWITTTHLRPLSFLINDLVKVDLNAISKCLKLTVIDNNNNEMEIVWKE